MAILDRKVLFLFEESLELAHKVQRLKLGKILFPHAYRKILQLQVFSKFLMHQLVRYSQEHQKKLLHGFVRLDYKLLLV